MAVRSTTFSIESAAQGLAGDLERVMTPVLTENLAYDQLAATQAQLFQLEKLNAVQVVPLHAETEDATHREALQQILTNFLAEMRGSAGAEMKQLASKLSGVGEAIDHMQNHVGNSGQQFADQMSLAASRLLTAATTLQESIDGRFERVATRIDALGAIFARGEALFSATAEKAASKLLSNFEQVDASLSSQIGTMRDIVTSLDRVRDILDSSATSWMTSAAPIAASVDASRQIAAELTQVADRVGTTQRDMTEMAKSVVQLSERVGSRFEKIDDDMQAVFERLQGGTRDFGAEVMDFVGKLDTSLANGMQAFSLGTEELREVAQMLVVGNEAKAA
jgi:methyl-accepting chemotaxis protein